MESLRESLANRYELGEVVGRGGMGVVYRAEDRVLARTVAVKVLPDDRAADPALVARFEREARSAGALNHPNIVRVYDTGHEQDTHFIVMEYVDGRSLAQILRQRGRLDPEQAARIGAQIARALGAAHRAGIVHRDIKPANVMLDGTRTIKVLDFGIARVAQGTSLTQTAVVLGSVPYLAPEVARGEPATERSDLYSLGCLLYELLTGRPPFTGELSAAVMHQHNTAQPVHPAEQNPLVPPALDGLVMQLLAKSPRDRPATAADVAQALASPRAATAPTRPAPTAPTRRLSATPPPTALTEPLRRRPWPGSARTVAIGLAVLAVIALLVALLDSSGAQPRPSAGHVRHRSVTHAQTKPARKPTTSTAPPQTTTPAHTPASPPAPITVPGAAGALTTLFTQDLQSGAIDQHGQDLLNHLQDILNSYEQGNVTDALHKVGDLTHHVDDLASHGDIRPSALPAITTGIDRLQSALLRSAPAETTPSGGPPGKGGKPHGPPPGHGPDHPHGPH